jgi:glycerol uptake operon antiterminator
LTHVKIKAILYKKDSRGGDSMKVSEIVSLLEQEPIVAAVKSFEGLEKSLTCSSLVVFVLFGDVLTISEIVARIKSAGKAAFVHIDLIDGLSAREVAVDFIAKNTQADGIISTKQSLVRYAKEKGLLTIQRFFVLDSIALFNIEKQMLTNATDLIEILPGVMPKIIRKIVNSTGKPIIAGGLISDKEDIVSALSAGATAISSTNTDVWFL